MQQIPVLCKNRILVFKRFTLFLAILIFSTRSSLIVAAEPIPFSLKRGVPEVEVVINGSIKASFIIDTGADHVYIDKTFAEKHGLLSGGKMPMRPVTGVDEKIDAFQIFLRSLKVGDLQKQVVSAVTIDLRNIVQDTSKGLPDGVVGYSFLKDKKLLFDYADSSIEFLAPYFHSQSWVETIVPIVMDRHLITVNTTVNDSIESKMILDTGASYSILSPALALLAGIKDSASVAKIRLDKKFTIGGVRVLIRDISSISKSLNNSRIDGILGTSCLSNHKFVIDYKNNQLFFIAN